MQDRVADIMRESISVKSSSLGGVPESAAAAARLLIDCVNGGGKMLICGNGGSAADAQHMVGEMVVRYERQRRALPAIALTTDSSVLTAQANDDNFETIFSRQVEALGAAGDVLVAISTSGTSPDVLAAVEAARALGMKVIGLTGSRGQELAGRCDVAVVVPSATTPRIQEVHITVIHALCELVESACSEE